MCAEDQVAGKRCEQEATVRSPGCSSVCQSDADVLRACVCIKVGYVVQQDVVRHKECIE